MIYKTQFVDKVVAEILMASVETYTLYFNGPVTVYCIFRADDKLRKKFLK